MKLRCEVRINDKLESILEAEQDVVLDHLLESFKMLDDDSSKTIIVTVKRSNVLTY